MRGLVIGYWLLVVGCWLLALSACASAESAPNIITPVSRETPTPDVSVVVIDPSMQATPAPTAEIISPEALGAGQHISASGSYTESETDAAGPMACQIQRNSCAFNRLARYDGADILFSNGEKAPFDDEDRLMHPAMIPPLARLAELVLAEWEGKAQILVNEAYDSQMAHDIGQQTPALKYSLHFEGRSIDMILWPPTVGLLGRLCMLAHDAGFDWVHNEGDHCHASVRAESLCGVCEANQP